MKNRYTGNSSRAEEPFSEFATYLNVLMDRKGLTIKDLQKATDSTYEACRRWVRGMILPSIPMRNHESLAKLLDVPAEELKIRIEKAKLMDSYGPLVTKMISSAGNDRHLQKIISIWPNLEAKDKEHAAAAISQIYSQRRASKALAAD